MTVTVKNTLNAASAPGSEKGEVRSFVVGQVPEGWAQLSGPVALEQQSSAAGTFVVEGFADKTGRGSTAYYQWPVDTANGRLFVSMVGSLLLEVDGDLRPVRTPATIPLLGSFSVLFVPLSDGNLLRLGGATSSLLGNTTQRYNVETRSFATLSPKPTQDIGATYSRAAQAGNGVVYGVFAQSTANFDAFNYGTNAWTEKVATSPSTGADCVGVVKLPSGKLLYVSKTGQYIFDPATNLFTQVNTIASMHSVMATATGARMFDMAATYATAAGNGLAFYDFDEASGTFVFTNPGIPNMIAAIPAATGLLFATVRNPYTGATIIKSLTVVPVKDIAYLHYQNYTPRGTVTAQKL